MNQFFLKHKNDICGSLIIDEDDGKIIAYKDNGSGLSPFLGNCDSKLIKKWWEYRAVPGSRKMIQKAIKEADCLNTELYLLKNLALSMTDAYWICPIDIDLKYEDVKLSTFPSHSITKIPYHNISSYDPNASLGGQMEKWWDLNYDKPILIKESYKYYGQQSVNEMFASLLHRKQQNSIPFVDYSIQRTKDNGVLCLCDSFTNDEIELIPAYEVLESTKLPNDMSKYQGYINICVKHGIDESTIRNFMDYQTLTDFIISNTDEHLLNFGILRNANTMELISPAPIYDSGNSMYFSEENKLYTRAELLERKINGFYDSEEKMLANIKDKKIVNLDLLPTSDEIINIYISAGIPEEKAIAISKNFETKVKMAHDFQHDIKISLYNEKQNSTIQDNEEQDETITNSIGMLL